MKGGIEMLSKIVTKEEALSKFHDGQTIMFSDWHGEFAADDIIERDKSFLNGFR